VQSLFFGSSTEPLYGVLHEPEGTSIRDFSVLICYPFGQEYMITHRAMRTLCVNMARAGVPSMRFDYAGTGDSYGEVFSIETSVQNTVQAAQELMELSGMEAIKVVGLRLGAAIAVQASKELDSIAQLTLWDPVVNGADYLNEIAPENADHNSLGDTLWASGYPIEPQVRKEIQKIDFQSGDLEKQRFLHFVLSQTNTAAERLIRSMKDKHANMVVDQSGLDDINTWIREDYNGSFLLPHKILKRIQEELLREY